MNNSLNAVCNNNLQFDVKYKKHIKTLTDYVKHCKQIPTSMEEEVFKGHIKIVTIFV